MMKALNIAATGMESQEMNVATISNNIANINTIGFKKGRTEFDDLLYETIQAPGSRSSSSSLNNIGIQIGSGSKVIAVRKNFGQGSPTITKNPFDLMISGEGFFGIIRPDNNISYTRNGSFSVNASGTLVNPKGFKVFPGLTFPPNTVSTAISESGSVEAFIANQIEPIAVGQIPIFSFTNSPGLKSSGGNLYRATKSSGPPIQQVAGNENAGSIMQGMLESSNVSIMNEMTDLIKAQRAYEMNAKVMGIADQMLQTVNNIR